MIDLSKIPSPDVFWWEDENGKKIKNDPMAPPLEEFPADQSMTSINLVAEESVFALPQKGHPLVRVLHWVINLLPAGWQKHNGELLRFSSTISTVDLPIINALTNVGWTITQAAIMANGMCRHCRDLVEETVNPTKNYLEDFCNHCEYCKDIDPSYDDQYRVRCVYHTYFFGNGDVKTSYNETRFISKRMSIL